MLQNLLAEDHIDTVIRKRQMHSVKDPKLGVLAGSLVEEFRVGQLEPDPADRRIGRAKDLDRVATTAPKVYDKGAGSAGKQPRNQVLGQYLRRRPARYRRS
jgi:hypothetical protein